MPTAQISCSIPSRQGVLLPHACSAPASPSSSAADNRGQVRPPHQLSGDKKKPHSSLHTHTHTHAEVRREQGLQPVAFQAQRRVQFDKSSATHRRAEALSAFSEEKRFSLRQLPV